MNRFCGSLLAVLATTIFIHPATALALLLTPNDVIAAGTGVSGTRGHTRIDPASGAQIPIASGNFVDFALADRQTIYAIESGAVVRVDVATGTRRTISGGELLTNPKGIAIDAYGRAQVLDQGASSGEWLV